MLNFVQINLMSSSIESDLPLEWVTCMSNISGLGGIMTTREKIELDVGFIWTKLRVGGNFAY